MIEAILFDADGVVLDTEGIWDLEQTEFLRRRGVVYDRTRTKHLMTGRTLPEGVQILQHAYGFSGELDLLAQERRDIFRSLCETEIAFMSGFSEFFGRLKDQYKTCVATSMDPEILPLIVEKMGLRDLFDDRIFSTTDVAGIAKPNPDLFLYAACRLGCDPARCLVIEDAPHGIEAARRAGMRCVGLATTYGPERLAAADLVARSFDDIDLSSIRGLCPVS